MIRGVGILIYHPSTNSLLVFERDNKPGIAFPGYLDLLGGHVEEGEAVKDALYRELAEELEVRQTGRPYRPSTLNLFTNYVDARGCLQNIYYTEIETRPELILKEGQRLVWLTEEEARETQFAYEFEVVVRQFFNRQRLARNLKSAVKGGKGF